MTTLFTGRIRPLSPAAAADLVEALLVDDEGRIVAVGATADLAAQDPSAERVALDGWTMPGLIEPHGHPGTAAVLLSDRVLDLRPVVLPDAESVMSALRSALAAAEGRPVYASGWDALLQRGLPDPDMRLLDDLAGSTPLAIVHNSGHSAYFNAAAARMAGLDRETPDPAGASFGRTADGELSGVALEAAAVEQVVAPLLRSAQADIVELLGAHFADLSRRGITTVSDLSWNPALNPVVDALRAAGRMPLRLRWYEMSRPGGTPAARPSNASDPVDGAADAEDGIVRQIGVKTWTDGSPWVGNIATSFPYLDTAATRSLGLEPHHRGSSNYTAEELHGIAEPYAAAGWQLACHAHGDLAIDETLDVYERLIEKHGLTDHRFRLEHVGAMTAAQFARAAELGVTVSLFVDHITYWGEVLVDDLFGPERGGAWADAGAAFAAGHRATFHNDGWVTPAEPLRNMAVAETRRTRSGRVMPAGTAVSRAQALAAHTTNAAWQLFSEHEVGSLAPGLFADLVVLDRDPLTAPAEELAEAVVREVHLGGRRVS
ncbi:MAG: amidohydrolase [Microbacterium sp.]|uniref:amidohydrolase n=1 Tax=Microbacterium sp. TaxID=51671 RepID=UPI0028376EAD|nr:amidohydrolase [Microbacterium sp.]MDR2322582.1 amidohydrolase [Microbacterium sp.]